MRKWPVALLASFSILVGTAAVASAAAPKTTYPVVFAHGMGGFDDILGYDYWGDDYGTFVGDACNEFLEVYCNGDIDSGQQAYAAQVAAFQSSEVRGLDLANDIEGFLATSGASMVNLVGHSQGGIDARKAARVLYERYGKTKVKVLISVSSPHRGSPVAKYVLDLGPGVTSVASALTNFYGNSVYQSGNDTVAALKQLVYKDYSSSDGATTGALAFNNLYPVDTKYAGRYGSLMTAQNGTSVNPALFLVSELFYDIDGDGYCSGDCDNDGAAGAGDGIKNERDDDGLVGVNSQHMGHRLKYTEQLLSLDTITNDATPGYVGSLNAPNSTQMTSMSSVISQDHLDVIGVGPDTFDEMEFYGALLSYIATYD